MLWKTLLALAAGFLCGCTAFELLSAGTEPDASGSTTSAQSIVLDSAGNPLSPAKSSSADGSTSRQYQMNRDRTAGTRHKLAKGEPTPISVSGIVRNAGGQPIPGAKVYLASHYGDNEFDGSDEPLAVVNTNEQGRYDFRDVLLQTRMGGGYIDANESFHRCLRGHFQVCCELEGYGVAWQDESWYSPIPRSMTRAEDAREHDYYQGDSIEQHLTLGAAQPLTGQIVDDRNQRVPNATVTVRRLYDTVRKKVGSDRPCELFLPTALPERFWQAKSDAEGRFTINGLPASAVADVTVEHDAYADQKLKSGAGPLQVRLRSTRGVLVEVVHRDGSPVQGAMISAANHDGSVTEASDSGESDEQGRVHLQLPPGKYTLSSVPNYASDTLLTQQDLIVLDQPGDQSCQMQVDRGCTLTLQAIDGKTGQGIPGVKFNILSQQDAGYFALHLAGPDTDDNGKLRLVVAPGVRRFEVIPINGYQPPGSGQPNLHDVNCEAGQTAHLQFKLKKQIALPAFMLGQ